MNNIQINTSQNVKIEFSLASFSDRVLAFVIDFVLRGAYFIIVLFILIKVVEIENLELDNWSKGAIFILCMLPYFFYSLACHTLMEGQTLGKKILKIQIIKIDGYQASFFDYLIRWVFSIVDVYFSLGLVGVISIISSKNNQRLGGMASGTAVINLKDNTSINHTILEEIEQEYSPQFVQVLLLNDADMQIIKTRFSLAKAQRDYKVIGKLADKIKEVTKIETNLLDVDFVEIIIKDYNFYTSQAEKR